MTGKLCAILVSDLPPDAPLDDLATLDMARDVANALARLGYETKTLPFAADLRATRTKLDDLKPAFAFNLVEAIFGQGALAFIAPALLEDMKIPFAGSGSSAIFATTDKLLAKQILRSHGIATPGWAHAPDFAGADEEKRYIVKNAREDASIGIHADSVVQSRAAIIARAAKANEERQGEWFAEEFVDGREFNIAVLEGGNGPEVMPLAEMTFHDYPEGKPKIVDYEAKWDENTFEYENSRRNFIDERKESTLAAKLRDTALKSWNAFALRGWGRVDMRVDGSGTPLVIDINANSDLSEGMGMADAAEAAGLSYDALIARIVKATLGAFSGEVGSGSPQKMRPNKII